jgi:hypothetical protein
MFPVMFFLCYCLHCCLYVYVSFPSLPLFFVDISLPRPVVYRYFRSSYLWKFTLFVNVYSLYTHNVVISSCCEIYYRGYIIVGSASLVRCRSGTISFSVLKDHAGEMAQRASLRVYRRRAVFYYQTHKRI